MPSNNQQGTDTEWQSEYDRQVAQWPTERLVNLKPMVKEAAVGYWNACHRQNAPEQVKQHFKECMQEVQDQQ